MKIMALFNIVNQAARLRAQLQELRKMVQLENIMFNEIRTELDKIHIRAAFLVESSNFNIDFIVTDADRNMGIVFAKNIRRIGSVFSNDVFDNVNKEKQTDPPDTKGMREEYNQAQDRFIIAHTASQVTKLGLTTKKLLRKIIQDGLNEGLSAKKIADAIREKRKRINKSRARRIARTEVHSVSQFATDEAIKASRVEFDREWVALKDKRTRNAHILSDKQKRKQNQPFDVGGEKLRFPGDPLGSAGNVINCRCVLIYHAVSRTAVRR